MARLLPIPMALALAACGVSSPQCPSNNAQGIVKALKPEQQFRAMLKEVTERTQTAAIVKQRDGSRSKNKIEHAVEAVVERHKAEWEQNLVNSWSTLNPMEIEEDCIALGKGNRSVFMKFTQRIGSVVRTSNEPLLKRAGAEVLQMIYLEDK